MAKVVTSRKYGRALVTGTPARVREQVAQQEDVAGRARPKGHPLEGQPQTDPLFEEQIVPP